VKTYIPNYILVIKLQLKTKCKGESRGYKTANITLAGQNVEVKHAFTSEGVLKTAVR